MLQLSKVKVCTNQKKSCNRDMTKHKRLMHKKSRKRWSMPEALVDVFAKEFCQENISLYYLSQNSEVSENELIGYKGTITASIHVNVYYAFYEKNPSSI